MSLVLVQSYEELQDAESNNCSLQHFLEPAGLEAYAAKALKQHCSRLILSFTSGSSTWSSLLKRIDGLGSFGLVKSIGLNQAKDSLAANGYDTEALHQ